MVDLNEALCIFQTINGARLEGRLENVQQRKKEIQRVHNSIQDNKTKLVEALHKDLGWNQLDSLLEITTVLQSLRSIFESLDLKTALQHEHDIAKGHREVALRVALGNILILGEASSPIAQTVIPLCLAVSEGNTALTILSHEAPKTSALLSDILSRSLDKEAIVVLMPSSESDRNSTLQVFQKYPFDAIVVQSVSTRDEMQSLSFQEKSPNLTVISHIPNPSVIAVTRNADIARAAQFIARAKFAFFCGASATGPGIVLVDEFVLEQFLTALEKALRGIAAHRPQSLKAKLQLLWEEASGALDKIEEMGKNSGARVFHPNLGVSGESILVGGPNWSIGEFHNMLDEKNKATLGFRGQVLKVVPTTSLEAMLAITNKFCADAPNSSVAVFANGSEARYLSIFLSNTNVYVNHVPVDTMITPYPSSILQQLRLLFYRERTIHAQNTASKLAAPQQLQQALASGKGNVAGLEEVISTVMDPPKQRSGKQVGFFPQGGMVGMFHFYGAAASLGGMALFFAAKGFLSVLRARGHM